MCEGLDGRNAYSSPSAGLTTCSDWGKKLGFRPNSIPCWRVDRDGPTLAWPGSHIYLDMPTMREGFQDSPRCLMAIACPGVGHLALVAIRHRGAAAEPQGL